MKKIEAKQFTTDLINQNKKQIEFFEGRKKRKHKNNTMVKAVAKTMSLSITYQEKENQRKKWSKNTKGPTMKMTMITIT